MVWLEQINSHEKAFLCLHVCWTPFKFSVWINPPEGYIFRMPLLLLFLSGWGTEIIYAFRLGAQPHTVKTEVSNDLRGFHKLPACTLVAGWLLGCSVTAGGTCVASLGNLSLLILEDWSAKVILAKLKDWLSAGYRLVSKSNVVNPINESKGNNEQYVASQHSLLHTFTRMKDNIWEICWVMVSDSLLYRDLWRKLSFLSFSLQWLMRKYPKVNTCPFGWKIPAVVLLNNPTAPPFPCFPVHCGMTNKQVQAEEESNVQPPHQGSVAVFLKASWCTSAESLGLWMNPHSKELHVVQTFTRTAWQCFCSLWWTLVPCVKGHKGHEWA